MPGVGNDATVAALYDAGWTRLTAFDYSAGAIERLRPLIGERAIALHVADARDLPYETASFDAVLDKGALDAIGIGGAADLQRAVDELSRVVAPGGVVVAISCARSNPTSCCGRLLERSGRSCATVPLLRGRRGEHRPGGGAVRVAWRRAARRDG